MKVEQRIGRIDRLGQRRREIVVLHFFYEGTVEARVYEALSRRIGWFETVVGELQPILRRAYLAIQRAAMEPPEGRDTVLAAELEAVAAERPLPELEGWHGHLEAAGPQAPLTSEDVAALFPAHGVAADEGEQRYDPYAQGASPKLTDLPPPPARPDLARLERVVDGVRWVGYYRFRRGSWEPAPTLKDLKEALEEPPPATPPDIGPAQRQFEEDLRGARSGR